MSQPADKAVRQPGLWAALGVATLALDIGVPLSVPRLESFWFPFLFIVLFSSQMTIHATWVVLGPGNFWWRISSIPLLLLIFQWFTFPLRPDFESSSFRLIFMGQWMLVVLIMLLTRGLGLKLRRDHEQSSSTPSRRQFSVGQLVALMTVAGFVAASLARIELFEQLWRDPAVWIAIAATVVLTLPPVFGVLVPRHPAAPAFATLFIPIGIALLPPLRGSTAEDSIIVVNILASFTVVQLIFWTFIRLEGYRLRRAGSLLQEASNDTPSSSQIR